MEHWNGMQLEAAFSRWRRWAMGSRAANFKLKVVLLHCHVDSRHFCRVVVIAGCGWA